MTLPAFSWFHPDRCRRSPKIPSGMQVREELPDLHTRRPPTQSDIYQMMYWYTWFSWWWALGCSKHVQKWKKTH